MRGDVIVVMAAEVKVIKARHCRLRHADVLQSKMRRRVKCSDDDRGIASDCDSARRELTAEELHGAAAGSERTGTRLCSQAATVRRCGDQHLLNSATLRE